MVRVTRNPNTNLFDAQGKYISSVKQLQHVDVWGKPKPLLPCEESPPRFTNSDCAKCPQRHTTCRDEEE